MIAPDVHISPTRVRRASALLLAVLAMLLLAAPSARATEEAPAEGASEEAPLTYDELRQEASGRAQEFFPDEYAEPSFFQWISVPVMVGGLVIAILLLGGYLWWQPRFAAERRSKQRRR